MISVSSSSITIIQRPVIGAVTHLPDGVGGTDAHYALSNPIEAIAAVTLKGDPKDSGAGWTVGFLQAQWIETNWGYYRGKSDADGSAFVQRARPPARPHQACFDRVPGAEKFYGKIGTDTLVPVAGGAPLLSAQALSASSTFPLTLNLIHRDYPSDAFSHTRQNSLTSKLNILHEAQVELSFCTVLVVRSPGDQLKFLAGFYWNVA